MTLIRAGTMAANTSGTWQVSLTAFFFFFERCTDDMETWVVRWWRKRLETGQ